MIIIDVKKKKSFVFGIWYNCPFLKEGLKKEGITKKSSNIFFRIYRVAILADILYKEGSKKAKKEDEIIQTESDIIALFFESFLFLLRTIYDDLLKILENNFKGELPKSFDKFIKNVEKGKYPEIEGKFKKYLLSKRFNFKEIRNFRNSIKMKTASTSAYIKNNVYHINALIYDNNTPNKPQKIDKELSVLTLDYVISLSLLMYYINRFMNKK